MGKEIAINNGISGTTEIFIVEEEYQKEQGDILDQSVKNLQLIKRGDKILTKNSGEVVLAQNDFFPVLFSQNGYTNIFGFVGRKKVV